MVFNLPHMIFGFAVSAPALPAPVIATSLPEIASPTMRSRMGAALVELLYGSPENAQMHALLAAPPERITAYILTQDVEKQNRADELKTWAENAIYDWNRKNSTAQIEIVSREQDADIVIEFKDRALYRGRHVAGYARWSRTTDGYSPHVNGVVHVSNKLPNGRLMNEEQVRHALGHELGHIFGLDDHYSSRSLMGKVSTAGNGQWLSDTEVKAISDMQERANMIISASNRPQIVGNTEVPKVFKFK